MDRISSIVRAHESGRTLLAYLTGRFTYKTSADWAELIGQHRFQRGNCSLQAQDCVFQGQRICYRMPKITEDSANLSFRIIDTTEDFYAVNKPPNLLVHNNNKTPTQNLIYQMRRMHCAAGDILDIVNRLDRHTSGVVLVARNKNALRHLNRLFSRRLVTKTYHALTEGIPTVPAGSITSDIVPDITSSFPYKYACDFSTPHPKAHTEYRLCATAEGYALIELLPRSGYTHQLRLHCASMNTPICNDYLYGLTDKDYRRRLQRTKHASDTGQLLHCSSISFPWTNGIYTVKAPFFEHMKGALQKLSLQKDNA
ncbi:MAG: RluA family pseudouridine synthase [Fibrobacterota bacterium]